MHLRLLSRLALGLSLILGTSLAPSEGAERQVAPGASVQAALDAAAPGDRVVLQAGLHYGRVTIPAGRTLAGVRGADGTWRSVLDGSDPVTATWEPAPEVAPGVWKTQLPYEPYAMQIDLPSCPASRLGPDCSRTIWRIGQDAMHERHSFAPGGGDAYLNWRNALNKGATERVTSYYTTESVAYWDGIEALFGYREGWTYLRFRDGRRPDSTRLRSSPGPACQHCLPTVGVVEFAGDGGAVQDLHLRGARNGVLVVKGATRSRIEGNDIIGGHVRIRLDLAGTGTVIRGNTLRGHTLANWRGGARISKLAHGPYERLVNWHLYFVTKFTLGDSGEDDTGVLVEGTRGVLIEGNTVVQSTVGIHVQEQAHDVILRGNTITTQIGQGLWVGRDVRGYQAINNLIADNGIGMRFQELERGNQDLLLARNRLWTPYGEQTWFHGTPREGAPSASIIVFLHNSFAAPPSLGDDAIDINVGERITSAPHVQLLNNLFGSGRVAGLARLGTVTGNLLPPGFAHPGNLLWTQRPWSLATVPDFVPPLAARDAAAPLPATLAAIAGVTVPVCGRSADVGAVEFCAAPPAPDIEGPRTLTIHRKD